MDPDAVYRVVGGIDRRMGILERDGDWRKGKGTFGINVGRPIVTNGDFVA